MKFNINLVLRDDDEIKKLKEACESLRHENKKLKDEKMRVELKYGDEVELNNRLHDILKDYNVPFRAIMKGGRR